MIQFVFDFHKDHQQSIKAKTGHQPLDARRIALGCNRAACQCLGHLHAVVSEKSLPNAYPVAVADDESVMVRRRERGRI